MSSEYQEKLRSLSFVSAPVTSKVTYDPIDDGVVRTTEKPESQDVLVALDRPVTPHWEDNGE